MRDEFIEKIKEIIEKLGNVFDIKNFPFDFILDDYFHWKSFFFTNCYYIDATYFQRIQEIIEQDSGCQ